MTYFAFSIDNRVVPVFLLVCSVMGAALPAVAANTVSFCFNNWPPYTRMTEKGAEGISVEIVKRAAEVLDEDIRFVEMEWSDCIAKVKNGELDAVMDAGVRKAFLQGPTSFSSYTDTFWVRNSSAVSHYEDLSGGTIAVVKGYNYTDRLLEQFEKLGLTVVYGTDDPTNIRDLARGKLDAAVGDLASTFAYAREHGLKVHPILPPFSVDLLFVSFNREKPELQRRFDRAFADLLEQGFVDDVYKRHIGATYASFADVITEPVE